MQELQQPLSAVKDRSCPRHVAIIMDGNRRWARRHGLPPVRGHAAGLERAVDVLRWCRDTPVQCVSLFAFATANWARDKAEVVDLMQLAVRAMRRFTPLAVEHRVRLTFLGRRERLPRTLRRLMELAEERTSGGSRELRIALDYSAQQAIVDAIGEKFCRGQGEVAVSDVDDLLGPPVDLLIRTGGERRLSNFLLWECANAELRFDERLWPDFDRDAWLDALRWFAHRERRFGR